MLYNFPDYSLLNLHQYGQHQGSHVFSFILKHCKDVAIVYPDDWKSYENYQWLDNVISEHLKNNKKVLLAPDEESFIWPPNVDAARVLNQYQDKPVWLITQLGGDAQKIYSFQHNFKIRLLELPYVFLELCEEYYRQHINYQFNNQRNYDHNFLCMTRRLQEHKEDLIKYLYKHNLNKYGLITISSTQRYPQWCKELCTVNVVEHPPFTGDYRTSLLVEANVANFLAFENEYKSIPLIVHAETGCGIFYATEKSLWPLLLGKLLLVHGPPNNVKYIQRFYDFSIESYANLEFDNPLSEWTADAHRNRLDTMLEKNFGLIQDCKEIYDTLLPEIESARWTIGKNFYKFITDQLKTIEGV